MSDRIATDSIIDQDRMMVLSLKPRFAEAILSGIKTVELRRIEPQITLPTRALVYATTPVKALLGRCIVDDVVSDSLQSLWQRYSSRTGLEYSEFLRYFDGVNTGTALTLSSPKRFDLQIPLAALRSNLRGFRPPQSFAYLDSARGDLLLQTAA